MLTAFQTPYGKFRWCRLPFGTRVSSELFQQRLLQALEGLQGIACVADDVLIYGQGDNVEEATTSHDQNLEQFLLRCRDKHIALNEEKFELRCPSVPFIGHIITKDGLRADPAKIEAIQCMKNPTDVAGVRRFIGFANYLAKFLPRLSSIVEPLRQLTRKDTDWLWTEEHDRAVQEVKDLATEAPVLVYYDPKKELVLQCDASGKGLGAGILQGGRPVAYASRSLTDTESMYSNLERETLAIVFGLNRFNQYTYGRKVEVHSDQKPLENILKKPLSQCPKRLQGMILSILNYDIDVVYKPGSTLALADMLSRAPLPKQHGSHSEQAGFERINMAKFLPIRDDRLAQLRRATDHDETLQTLKAVIHRGWPDNKSNLPLQVHPYFTLREELSIQDGLVFKGERIVVPHSLRSDMKQCIHTSHVGTDSCLRRASES